MSDEATFHELMARMHEKRFREAWNPDPADRDAAAKHFAIADALKRREGGR